MKPGLNLKETNATSVGSARPLYYDSGHYYDTGLYYDRWQGGDESTVQGEKPDISVSQEEVKKSAKIESVKIKKVEEL